MKKNFLTALCAGILGSAVILSGSVCTFAAEAETAAEETAELKTIGAKEKEEGAFAVKLTNATGKDIKDIKIKVSGRSEFTDVENLLEKDEIFVADEERMLNYLPELKEEEETKEDTEPEVKVFDIQLTFADDTTAVVHTFPFGDIEEGKFCMDGELAYLVFESVSLKEEINTLETEKTIAETIKAQEEAAQAAANASSDNYYDSYSDDSGYSYESSGSSNSGSSAAPDQCLTGGLLN